MTGDHKSQTRKQILKAALNLARKRGIAAVTMVDVAKAAGITRQTVYFYFRSRTGLLTETMHFEDVTHPLGSTLWQISQAAPSVKTYEAFVTTWFRFVADVRAIALAVQAESVHGAGARAAWKSRQDVAVQMLNRITSGLREQKLLKPGWTAEEAAEWTFVHLDPATYHNLVVMRGWSPEVALARTLETLKLALIRK
jgi:AcrR family transcriptional regulator